MLEQYGITQLEVDFDGSLSYPEPVLDQKDNAERSVPKPLNCDEEQLMRLFYEQKIQEVCAAFKFPHKIQATTKKYFKGFYLKWSVMEHHPKHIMLTCIYASCKVEENHVSAEELGFVEDMEDFCQASVNKSKWNPNVTLSVIWF